MNQDKKPLNWEHMNDVELKVELGRLVDRAKDGNEMKEMINAQVTETHRLWPFITRYLCMERLQKIESIATKRASFKVAQYLSAVDAKLVRLAFDQLLEYCCENFEDSFDALYQRVASVVDFGRRLGSNKSGEEGMMVSDPFFKILKVQETTSDNNIYRLAFRFIQFLGRIFSVDGQTFELNDSVKDNDTIARLFDDALREKEEDGGGFKLPRDELVDLCRRRAPKTVKAFTEAFCSKEDPVDILIAFECFPQFSISNKSAICAQSEQMINTLLLMENKFSIDEFSAKVNNCIVHTLLADTSQVPVFCQRIQSVRGSIQRMRIVNCVDMLTQKLLEGKEQVHQPVGKAAGKPKEIGKVVRRSAALTTNKTAVPSTKQVVDVVDKVLRPFLISLMNFPGKFDPITISGALRLLSNLQQQQVPGFRRILGDYFALLSQARHLEDWQTRLICVGCYAGLAQMASQKDEDRVEWTQHFQGVDEWLSTMTSRSISQTNREQYVQLDHFQRTLSAFFGSMGV